MTKSDEYVLHGQRVIPMTPQEIQYTAQRAMSLLRIDKSTIHTMDEFIENLWDRYSINVEIIGNNSWLGFAEALCDPSSFTIALPESLYLKMIKDRDNKSIFIFFHELGHLLLGHKPVLHYSSLPPTQFEDAEWQADYFAEIILNKLGEFKYKQLELFNESK